MLTVAEETLQQLAEEHGKQVATHLYGQEINAETYAICKADLLLKGEGEAADNIVGGPEYSTLSNDAFPSREFDFMLSNPPYGKSWKSDLERMGGKSRHQGPALRHRACRRPRILARHPVERRADAVPRQHAVEDEARHQARQPHRRGPQRLSLFTGDAGQGESNIRRWIIENDWLEAIVALPLNMFYNTGIATYIWVLTNRKPAHRSGKVQLIDATAWFKPLRKNLGKKNCELSEDGHRAHLRHVPGVRGDRAVEDLRQRRIRLLEGDGRAAAAPARASTPSAVVPAPRRSRRSRPSGQSIETAPPVIRKIHKRGTRSPTRCTACSRRHRRQACVVEYEPDSDLRDTEQVPLTEPGGIEAFIRREVLPHAPDAWNDPIEHQDRLRDQLHPLLLQAAAVALAGRDPRRHPGAGERDRGPAGRDHRGGG